VPAASMRYLVSRYSLFPVGSNNGLPTSNCLVSRADVPSPAMFAFPFSIEEYARDYVATVNMKTRR